MVNVHVRKECVTRNQKVMASANTVNSAEIAIANTARIAPLVRIVYVYTKYPGITRRTRHRQRDRKELQAQKTR